MLKHYKDLTPYLRTCNTLQLSPDFLIPQDNMGDEEMSGRSTVVDCDEAMSSYSSGSSGSENMSSMACTENIVRKRRSGWTSMCAKFMANSNKVSDEDMATSMSRRKGIPHRSPLC